MAHQGKKPFERLKNHLAYLAALYKDALDNNKDYVRINANCHCSPLKFYGNGISIKNDDNPYVQCWKNLFDREEDYLDAKDKLIEVFKNNGKMLKKSYNNEFERYHSFLEAMVQSFKVLGWHKWILWVENCKLNFTKIVNL